MSWTLFISPREPGTRSHCSDHLRETVLGRIRLQTPSWWKRKAPGAAEVRHSPLKLTCIQVRCPGWEASRHPLSCQVTSLVTPLADITVPAQVHTAPFSWLPRGCRSGRSGARWSQCPVALGCEDTHATPGPRTPLILLSTEPPSRPLLIGHFCSCGPHPVQRSQK